MSRGNNRSVTNAVSNSPANIPRLIRLLDRLMANDALLWEGQAVKGSDSEADISVAL